MHVPPIGNPDRQDLLTLVHSYAIHSNIPIGIYVSVPTLPKTSAGESRILTSPFNLFFLLPIDRAQWQSSWESMRVVFSTLVGSQSFGAVTEYQYDGRIIRCS